jgi:type III restriction enzyme
MDRASGRLIDLIGKEAKKSASKPKYEEVVEIKEIGKARIGRPKISENLAGKYERGAGYRYSKSVYTQDWFDSSTERDAANMLQEASEVEAFLRLQTGDLGILWAKDRSYNPDFIVVERSGDHFVLEIKMDKERESADVKGKREAARRWATYVNEDDRVQPSWAYLLAFEKDVRDAAGSWSALKGLSS